MTFLQIYLVNFACIIIMMTLLWLISVKLHNVSIVDSFWGFGFVLSVSVYAFTTEGLEFKKLLLIAMVLLWGMRLSIYLAWRNFGKGEDFRYREFRKQYGENRYWWISFFQVFLLQGILMWLISAPLLGALYGGSTQELRVTDVAGILIWLIGFAFEAGGDWQLARFKSDPANNRHPNYFGDAAVWWGFGLFSFSAGSYIPILGSLLMTALIVKVSGVALLEKSLKSDKPEYAEYVRKTSAFIPWFPKK